MSAAVKRYVFKRGTEPWPEGETLLHLYAPVNLTINPELAELIYRWRAVIVDDPITLLRDKDLHLTLEVVTDRRAQDIPSEERAELAAAVREALRGVRAYRGRAGGCLAYSSGVIVDISPAAPLMAIHQRLRSVVQSVRGPDSTAYPVSKVHASLGYATQDADSDLIQKRLRTVDPNNAPLYVPEVHMVEVGIAQDTGMLTWDTVEVFPLDASD